MPENTKKNVNTLLLYSTSGCHLCEQAVSLVEQLSDKKDKRFELNIIDIANDDKLFERYGVSIPVIKFMHKTPELFWPFSLEDLQSFVQ